MPAAEMAIDEPEQGVPVLKREGLPIEIGG